MTAQKKPTVLIIASVFILFLLSFYLLFANTLLRQIAEDKASQALGAEVNIAQVSHQLWPLQVQLSGIQLTDATNPTNNQVVISHIKAELALLPLLSRDLIIEQLMIDEISFNQVREKPGKVLRPAQPSLTTQANKIWHQLSSPSLANISEQLNLQSPHLATQINQQKDALTTATEHFDDFLAKNKLGTYQAQIKALQKTDWQDPQQLLQAKQQLTQLKSQFTRDRAMLNKQLQALRNTAAQLQNTVAHVKTALSDDQRNIQQLLSFDQQTQTALLNSIFGEQAEQVNGLLVTLSHWWQKPDDENQSASPFDYYLLKQGKLTVKVQEQRFTGQFENISNDLLRTAEQSHYLIQSAQDSSKTLSLRGQFSADKNGLDGQQTWLINDLLLSQLWLQQRPELAVLIEQARFFMNGELSIQDGQLSGQQQVDIANLVWQVTSQNAQLNWLTESLQALDSFNFVTNISGPIKQPEINVHSDLDDLLKQPLQAFANRQTLELQQRLQDNVAAQLGESESLLATLAAQISTAEKQDAAFNQLLQTQLNDQVKDKLNDKLKKKLTSLFSG